MPEPRSAPPRRGVVSGFSRTAGGTDAVVLALASLAAFRPVLHNEFVSWDDPSVLLDNPHLGEAGIVRWAFSTTVMGHYQPLAWTVWSIVKAQFGMWPPAFHGLSLLVHTVNGILVYALMLQFTRDAALQPRQRRAAALLAGLVFLLHPTAVESVAWASAFPYVLSLLVLLLSF